MASKRLRELNIDSCLSREGVDSELSLLDDEDEELPVRASAASGQLSLVVDGQEKQSQAKDEQPNRRYLEQLSVESYHGDSRGILFEVSSARIVKQARNKYVTYTLTITNNVFLLSSTATVEKRYSDFEKLNSSLHKKFPQAMKSVSFPKKIISGNFKDETIAQRSRAFEQFLSHIYAIDGVAESEEFRSFFFKSDLSHAFALFFTAQYEECVDLMEHCVLVQEKILSPRHPDLITTLCTLAAAYNEMEQYRKAEKYCRYALQAIDDDDLNHYLVPVLQLTIRLCWQLEKSKHGLEAWLSELQQKGVDVANTPRLLDVVVKSFDGRDSNQVRK